ncbi:hypothetical protein Misp01_50910 [Microtetraspora sp. NBRC 13810]|uniref:hypothetical protein n=1 Tax=Microtetraspora sp. NBRC 13810 TaxID=3030990 RepID=UPI0024A0FE1A|nr:hypothetical protein [Microtetraspora sp. NBRC 13810]GLW09962.1 hypothetical protein Misp01_50910 [Microtetraspora sp. NBRC 13810]
MDDVREIDAEGRRAAGRGLRELAEEHALHRARMDGMGGESPVPYDEVAGPYREFLASYVAGWDEVTGRLGFAGAGQLAMADTDTHTENANVTGVARVMDA